MRPRTVFDLLILEVKGSTYKFLRPSRRGQCLLPRFLVASGKYGIDNYDNYYFSK
jgi:hypothetical protein